MIAKLIGIYARPGKGQPVVSLPSAALVAGLGLAEDYFSKKNGKRQITILSNEAWSLACNELDLVIDPSIRRANLLVEGLALKETVGKLLQIGRAVIRVEGETLPCRLMDDQHPGLKDALGKEWRGGVYGSILADGYVRVGDEIKWTSGV